MSQISPKRIPRFLDMAKEASLNSDFEQHKLGAILVYKGTQLASGCNNKKTSPVQKRYNRFRDDFDVEADYQNANSLHAEIACLNKVQYLDIDFSKTAMVIYRGHKNGHKALARPCSACRRRMLDMGIHDVYYSTDSGWCHEYLED